MYVTCRCLSFYISNVVTYVVATYIQQFLWCFFYVMRDSYNDTIRTEVFGPHPVALAYKSSLPASLFIKLFQRLVFN